jgi:hypothetical protein
LLAKNL